MARTRPLIVATLLVCAGFAVLGTPAHANPLSGPVGDACSESVIFVSVGTVCETGPNANDTAQNVDDALAASNALTNATAFVLSLFQEHDGNFTQTCESADQTEDVEFNATFCGTPAPGMLDSTRDYATQAAAFLQNLTSDGSELGAIAGVCDQADDVDSEGSFNETVCNSELYDISAYYREWNVQDGPSDGNFTRACNNVTQDDHFQDGQFFNALCGSDAGPGQFNASAPAGQLDALRDGGIPEPTLADPTGVLGCPSDNPVGNLTNLTNCAILQQIPTPNADDPVGTAIGVLVFGYTTLDMVFEEVPAPFCVPDETSDDACITVRQTNGYVGLLVDQDGNNFLTVDINCGYADTDCDRRSLGNETDPNNLGNPTNQSALGAPAPPSLDPQQLQQTVEQEVAEAQGEAETAIATVVGMVPSLPGIDPLAVVVGVLVTLYEALDGVSDIIGEEPQCAEELGLCIQVRQTNGYAGVLLFVDGNNVVTFDVNCGYSDTDCDQKSLGQETSSDPLGNPTSAGSLPPVPQVGPDANLTTILGNLQTCVDEAEAPGESHILCAARLKPLILYHATEPDQVCLYDDANLNGAREPQEVMACRDLPPQSDSLGHPNLHLEYAGLVPASICLYDDGNQNGRVDEGEATELCSGLDTQPVITALDDAVADVQQLAEDCDFQDMQPECPAEPVAGLPAACIPNPSADGCPVQGVAGALCLGGSELPGCVPSPPNPPVPDDGAPDEYPGTLLGYLGGAFAAWLSSLLPP